MTHHGQTPTVGLMHYDSSAQAGYMLLTPEKSSDVYLLNACGQKVNYWATSTNTLVAYILANGNLLKVGQGIGEMYDWDGNLLWSYDFRANGISQHHDIEPLPNGNFLILAREDILEADAISEGRDPSLLSGAIKLEIVLEIAPVGSNTIAVEWEWKLSDHIIQDFDNTKGNYGVVENHPELMDYNYATSNNVDWIHTNGIDYNADLDQIIISARNTNEVYIVDHSTSTSQAAGHSGGNSNKGGDFLWRWGNPQVYRQGTSADQKLFSQHDPNWIPNTYPNGGMISIFNNKLGNPSNYSAIEVVNTSTDANGDYEFTGNIFSPTTSFWSWDGDILGATVYGAKKSGTQALANGNFLISESDKGRISEITSSGALASVYLCPINAAGTISQYSVPSSNTVFKVYKYAEDYIGFTGRSLLPGTIIENENTASAACESLLSISLQGELNQISIYPNPMKGNTIYFNRILNNHRISLFDIVGKQVFSKHIARSNSITVPKNIAAGIYVIRIYDPEGGALNQYKLIKE